MMKIGTHEVEGIYAGENPVRRAHLGDDEVFDDIAMDDDFIFVFDTARSEAADPLVLAIRMGGTVDCTVYWGDGDSNAYTTNGEKTHTYEEAGIYTVRISGTMTEATPDAPPFWGNTLPSRAVTKVLSFGDIDLTDARQIFRNHNFLTEVPKRLWPDVKILRSTFQQCERLTTIKCRYWDVSKVTNIGHMFHLSAGGGNNIANPDVSLWNTSAVTNMQAVFSRCGTINPNVSNWNTANVTNMSEMFNLTSGANPDLSKWVVKTNLTTMAQMLDSSGISVANYSRWLIRIANQVHANGAPFSIALGASGRNYNATQHTDIPGEYDNAVDAREYLTKLVANDGAGWTITDGGPE